MSDTLTPQVIPVSLGLVSAFLVKGERPLLVDTGIAPNPQTILAALDRHGVDPRSISLILITHAHTDHAGGLAALKRATGAPVAVHQSEAECLREGRPAEVRATGPATRLLRAVLPQGRLAPVEPDVLVGAELALAPFGVDGRVLHTPGHTGGSLSLLLAEGEVLIGDLARGASGGRAGASPFAQNLSQLRQSLIKVADLAPTTIYPAHGRPFPAAALQPLIDRLTR